MTVDCPEEIFKQKAQTFWEVGGSSDEGEEVFKAEKLQSRFGKLRQSFLRLLVIGGGGS